MHKSGSYDMTHMHYTEEDLVPVQYIQTRVIN